MGSYERARPWGEADATKAATAAYIISDWTRDRVIGVPTSAQTPLGYRQGTP